MDIELLAKWTAMASQLHRRNRHIFRICDKISKRYTEHGFRTMVLKGQGAALRYPNPFSRTPGDIDLFAAGGYEKVLRFVDKTYGIHSKFNMHHVDVPSIDGVSVELHYRCATFRNPWSYRKLQIWLDNHIDSQLNNLSAIKIEGHEIAFHSPTVTFNLVYELVHIYNHFMFEGIGMRQLVDYYMLLQQPEAATAIDAVSKDIKKLNLFKIASAVMWVLQATLGLEKSKMLVKPDKRRGKFLYNKILVGGNFGQQAKDIQALHNSGRFTRYLRRLWRSWTLALYFPGEALWDVYFRYQIHVWQRSAKIV